MLDSIRQFVWSEDGAAATEYAVLLALMLLVCIAAVTTLGKKVNNTFSAVNANLPGV